MGCASRLATLPRDSQSFSRCTFRMDSSPIPGCHPLQRSRDSLRVIYRPRRLPRQNEPVDLTIADLFTEFNTLFSGVSELNPRDSATECTPTHSLSAAS